LQAIFSSRSALTDRSWDTTVVAVIGNLGLDDDTLALLRSAWPTPEAQRNV
jgi:hypothetical protein